MPLPFHILLEQRLQAGGMDLREARAVARLLLEEAGGVTLTAICAHGADDALPTPVKERLCAMAGRVAAGEPAQYVVGAASFCGLRLRVNPGVLIPRPETEQLADDIARTDLPRLLSSAPPVPLRLLDIGTGCGCIALALKKACPEAAVEGWDISPRALALARDNAARLQLDVTFRQRDILCFDGDNEANAAESLRSSQSLKSSQSLRSLKSLRSSQPLESLTSSQSLTSLKLAEASDEASFSLIVSNPPYVCEREAAAMEPRVLRHEPREALFVSDEDPLRFYRAIARAGRRLLRRGGLLRLEINRDFGTEMRQLLCEERYTSVEIKKDLYGNNRYAYATWNP